MRGDRDVRILRTISVTTIIMYRKIHINFSPNNEPIKSTAKIAVLLLSSSIGLTSTNSADVTISDSANISIAKWLSRYVTPPLTGVPTPGASDGSIPSRSEEHTSELQSRFDLVCRLLLENK